MRSILVVAGVALSLAACQAEVNERRASLMPEPVARQIVAKYMGEAWLNAPHVFDNPTFCGRRRMDVTIARIDYAAWSPGEGFHIAAHGRQRFRWDCGIGGVYDVPTVKTEPEANELADALVSLGAVIRKW